MTTQERTKSYAKSVLEEELERYIRYKSIVESDKVDKEEELKNTILNLQKIDSKIRDLNESLRLFSD